MRALHPTKRKVGAWRGPWLRDSLNHGRIPSVKTLGLDIPSLPGRAFLSKHPLPVDRDPGLSQERHELLLERPLPMILSLLRNVMGDDLLLRLAYTERAKSLLPCEFRPALVLPVRAVALEVLYYFGQRHRRRKCNQQVNVVRRASRRQQRDSLRAGNAGQVLTHLADIRDQIKTALRAEDAMRQDPCVGVRHVCNLGSG